MNRFAVAATPPYCRRKATHNRLRCGLLDRITSRPTPQRPPSKPQNLARAGRGRVISVSAPASMGHGHRAVGATHTAASSPTPPLDATVGREGRCGRRMRSGCAPAVICAAPACAWMAKSTAGCGGPMGIRRLSGLAIPSCRHERSRSFELTAVVSALAATARFNIMLSIGH